MRRYTRRAVLAAPAGLALPAWQRESRPEGPPQKRLLAQARTAEDVGRALVAREQWTPYPRSADRAAWEGLAAGTRTALVRAGEARLGQSWPSLPASVFLDFQRNGNRTRWEDLHFGRRNRLRGAVLAECVENKGRFLDEILDGLWLLSEESFWGVPAHIGMQKAGGGLPDAGEPIVDLFAAETGNAIAWTDYLLGPQLERLSKLLRPRLRAEVERRLLEPLLTRSDFGWMGLDPARPTYVNNWNPWIVSNWLTVNLLMEPDGRRRAAAALKAMKTVDRFLDSYHDDGGCDEGPGYWSRAGASLFDCLELLHSASAGRLDFYGVPLVREIGRYVYRAHIAGDWYTNFADAPARVRPDGNLVWRYGRRIGDAQMAAHGAWAASRRTGELDGLEAMGRKLDALFHQAELSAASSGAKPPLVRDVMLGGTQVFAARMKEGSTEGFYVAAQGGHNAESHNHNDVGNFIVFHDGEPVLIDVGVETYTAKTFSAKRYEIWTMQSAWHNCPTINGAQQAAGRKFEAHGFKNTTDDSGARLEMNIERAYPAEAGVRSWRREIALDRVKGRVVLTDRYALSKRESIELSLITTRAARVSGAGEVTLDGGYVIRFDKAWRAAIDEHSSEDARLKPNWGPLVRRIRLAVSNPPAEGSCSVVIERA
ncbi:MAG: heparinase II/III family protein [Candidatus Solibacter usitatus]|nr:heparinase II/III family protein [Candidatus Solibacter usitatus]